MSDNDDQVSVSEKTEATEATETTETTEKTDAAPAATEPVIENKPTEIEDVTTTSAPDPAKTEPLLDIDKIGLLNEVYILLSIEIGRAQIKIKDLLKLNKGSIIELDKLAGEPVDVYANGKLISTGNIITANGKYCVRLASVSEKSKKAAEHKNEDKSDGK